MRTVSRGGGTALKKRRPRLQGPSTTGAHRHEDKDQKPVELSSPTSISMKNSYIIKNADPSFDAYYNSMKRRSKIQMTLNGGASSLGGQDRTLTTIMENQIGAASSLHNPAKVAGKRPMARDGHTGILFGESLLVFGGDRHHMPFNDMFMLDLKKEFAVRGGQF